MPNTTTVDEELYDGLQQARKKKPRNFCLVAKGAEVVKLIVQKKKINDGQAQKAKSEAKGNLVITGVVIGEGMELSFEITGSEPSITAKKIKDYISDNTDLTLKPKWTVVTELRTVEEEEGKESEGQAKAPPQAKSGTPPVPPPQVTPPPPTSGTTPPVPPPPPPKSGETPPKTQTPPVVPQTPPGKTPDIDGQIAELVAKMSKLTPAIQPAAAAFPQRKVEFAKPVADFKQQVKDKDVEKVRESLRVVGKLLKEMTGGGQAPLVPPPLPGTKPSGEGSPPVPPPRPGATGEREQGESETEEGKQAEDPADRFRQDWAAARKQLRLAIDKVEEQLLGLAEALLKSHDPNMIWVAENGLTQLMGGLRASATTIDKTASKTPAKTAAFAKPALAELEKQLNHVQVKVCDQNQFGAKVSVKKTIGEAIEELVKTLESAA